MRGRIWIDPSRALPGCRSARRTLRARATVVLRDVPRRLYESVSAHGGTPRCILSVPGGKTKMLVKNLYEMTTYFNRSCAFFLERGARMRPVILLWLIFRVLFERKMTMTNIDGRRGPADKFRRRSPSEPVRSDGDD